MDASRGPIPSAFAGQRWLIFSSLGPEKTVPVNRCDTLISFGAFIHQASGLELTFMSLHLPEALSGLRTIISFPNLLPVPSLHFH